MINYKLYRNRLIGQNGAQEVKANRQNGANGRHEVCGLNRAHSALSFIIYHLSFIISTLSFILLLTCPFSVQAQIKIGGNVYGGGNHAEVKGSTKVTVKAGDIGAVMDPNATRPLADPQGRVFGGARMADVGGSTFVNIDGEGATDYILINQVYGGNDIAGTIGNAKAVGEGVPSELTAILPEPTTAQLTASGKTRDKWREDYKTDNPKLNDVDNRFNSYVRVSTKTLDRNNPDNYFTEAEVAAAANNPEDPAWNKTPGKDLKPDLTAKKVYIGQLFAGGNGDFEYPAEKVNGQYVIKQNGTIIAKSLTPFVRPEVDSTYLEVVGGSIVYAYGGGNNATVKKKNIIHVDNPSGVTNHIYINKNTWVEDLAATAESGDIIDLLSTARFKEMGINTAFSKPSSGEYQIGRFFGGNNKAEMSIRPEWNLLAGKIRNLYSGGNKGNMTSPEGLLLEIPSYSTLIVDYVYGGCRMADVVPTVEGAYVPCTNLQEKDGEGNLKYKFPNELSARILVRGGNINTVYGGNDVTGKVYDGNAIGIYTSIHGDVYGGGNGAYPYTDNKDYENHDVYGDFYYAKGASSVESLNAHRPNAEQVSIRLKGADATHPTVIHGSVFVGGNCATLKNVKTKPLVELKMGSYVIADNVFLGNNGEDMTYEDYLKLYANVTAPDYSTLTLTDPETFASYMNGAAMELQPAIVFDSEGEGDPATYIPNSSYVGSFYCGGNVGSMIIPGKNTYKIDQKLNIYTKFVGGCNKAYVGAIDGLCAAYDGGVLGSASEQPDYTDGAGNIKDRLNIKLENLTITPLRWNDTNQYLVWNTYRWSGYYSAVENGKTLTKGEVYYTSNTGEGMFEAVGTEVSTGSNYYTWEMSEDDESDFEPVPSTPVNAANRLLGGNVYGGCYESGHVNGNIVIDINEDVLERDEVFGTGFSTVFGRAKSGVEFLDQRDDLNTVALIVFGGGYGEDSEVWGSTTVNHNKGYVFQICGGGEMGVVGKHTGTTEAEDGTYTRNDISGDIDSYASNGRVYKYKAAYSSTVNLKGSVTATSNEGAVSGLAETEYIYAGGKEGLVCGNTIVNLGNGRLYDAFGGACEADVLGHSEAYIGRQPDGSGGYQDAFPWIQDIVYGGNDFTGTIYGQANFKDKVRVETGEGAFDVLGKVHNPGGKATPDVLFANAYVEYLRGRVDTIYGGNYGFYDYMDPILLDEHGDPYPQPEVKSTFVNIRPDMVPNSNNAITAIFGGSTGYFGNREGDHRQDRSYVLIDIPDNLDNFRTTEIFGAGSFNGLGMNSSYADIKDPEYNADEKSAIIDLMRGKVGAAYGGSFMEGVTRRTMVNVPYGSTINIGSIFGGAYGQDLLSPCDVYEAHVNYSSPDALLVYDPDNDLMKGAIYGGNNTCRRTLYGFIDIDAPVWEQHPIYGKTRATVYGAGCGPMTWSEYTEVNLNKKPDGVTGDYTGAEVYEVYGGAQNGEVLNAESAKTFMNAFLNPQDLPEYLQAIYDERGYNDEIWEKLWPQCWTIGEGYYYPYTESGTFDVSTKFDGYPDNEATNLTNVLTRVEDMDDRDYSDPRNNPDDRYKYNTNVRIHEGAYVANYAYGGGLGTSGMTGTGDVYGTTYIALLGGEVKKDIYAAGTIGVVHDNYESHEFIASSNAYIKGGTCRNVYGGGWEGSVGKHTGGLNAPYYDFVNNKSLDIPGETHVVIGDIGDDKTFANGKPAIQRNAYGGGEGGSIYGTANLTINNGMIGYRYKNTATGDASASYDYVPELDDKSPGDNVLDGSGNAFGGGYILNSYVDNTHVKMFGGQVRGCLYGGGEVGPIGRGTIRYKDTYSTSGIVNGKARIFKAGKTHVEMFNGHVLRNVFGGGRGVDSWGGDGTYSMKEEVLATLDKDCKGFIFGQTEVDIYGGEVGTNEGMAYNFGNVFGGCDEGTVYSAYEKSDGTLGYGEKIGVRYGDDPHEGYYFKKENGAFVPETVAGETHNIYTEDCKVLVEPWLQVKTTPITYGGKTYAVGDYIPTAYLNTLKAKTSDGWPAGWDNVDAGKNVTIDAKEVFQERGIIIHNAVFAGGNIALGSSSVSANETTVYGNATASIHDVYNRDLITIGTGHTGGLYGDGNLTLVDGYRELNITNYGTDKYHLANELAKNLYDKLPAREQAYYEVKYKCIAENGCTDIENTTYKNGSIVPHDEIVALFTDNNGHSLKIKDDGSIATDGTGTPALIENDAHQLVVPNPLIWQENGVVSTYAGRIMNTIQRADFCGVFGSRMVMKGARDRVTDKEDSKLYTINRVREVSLNKMDSPAGDTGDNASHGNYFGIYSNVNFLGSLTSDVDFYSTRTTNADLVKNPQLAPNSSNETFAEWKALHIKDRKRNNGNCHNQLALASGVYLELTSEKSTGTRVDQKDWGLITGVVELDLINVSTGVGGGYVYAKNQHGERITGHQNTTLTKLNKDAVSKFKWDYKTADGDRKEWETSGNFIHSSQTIIDDCYNISNKYLSADGVPAHYWYIAGSVYVYDQYITAYTGSPNAYSKTVELPITINAASNGKMTLMDVQPNLYAYYATYSNASINTPLTGNSKVVINNVEYHLNDPIDYWEWKKLPASEQKLFVEETYVVRSDCKIGETIYPAGTVLLPSKYNELSGNTTVVTKLEKNETGDYVVVKDKDDNDVTQLFTEVFRSSNNLSHTTGYLLTYDVTNPEIWKPWYTELTGDSRSNKITSAEYNALAKESKKDNEGNTIKGQDAYTEGPTYTPNATGLYGQRKYEDGDIIPNDIYNTYTSINTDYIPNYGKSEGSEGYDESKKQATFVPAYVVTKEYSSTGLHFYEGAPISEATANSLGAGYAAPAYVCTHTIELSGTDYIYVNDLMTESEKTTLHNRFKAGGPEENLSIAKEIEDLIVPAYYCTSGGLYGGEVFNKGQNYRALGVWSSMSEADRSHFTFNYDALDLLIDPTYGITHEEGTRLMQKEGTKYQYDGYDAYSDSYEENMIYSLSKPIDYTATYDDNTTLTVESAVTVKRPGSSEPVSTTDILKNDELSRTVYESLPNEQRHYAPIKVTVGDVVKDTYTVYVVKEGFVHIETPYAVGATLTDEEFTALASEEKAHITTLTFSKGDLDPVNSNPAANTSYNFYYCRESYKVNEKGMGRNVKSIKGEGSGTTYTASSDAVPQGAVIADDDYTALVNKQKNFTIHGVSPMETSTLYVSRESDINDLSKEKIITVIYKYDYEESDESGLHVTPVSERHIVNIHIQFESGVPIVEDIKAPNIVLPGTSITMRVPTVTPGAYEILGGGWELFEKDSYAESHTNGTPYKPAVDSLYWYQDGFLLAYYAKTYLGKTYSNAVPVRVANYHDLKSVMNDKTKHLHVDYDRSRLKRDSKIYINDYTSSDMNGLDLFKDFYDLSLVTSSSSDYEIEDGVITSVGVGGNSNLEGHTLLNTEVRRIDNKDVMVGVKAGTNLEFFLRTDIEHEDNPAVTNEWTPIGNDAGTCFNGTFHGDGHTLRGLDNSLFGHLCGSVYNLGVMGSFTSAGVADEGGGYIESCWVKTTGTPATGVKAVFGNPTTGSGFRLVNCYYSDSNHGYTAGAATEAPGAATEMPDATFYNGEVAYDLNSFYLNKRYYDKNDPGEGARSFRFWPLNADGSRADVPATITYPSVATIAPYGDVSYVEERFADGDFVFAAGEIPTTEDERHFEVTTTDPETKTDYYYPIWPDDYLFFGQRLNYGYAMSPHQDVPTAIVRASGRLAQNAQANRVYRAPAYYRSNEMNAAHFNPNAYLAQISKDGTKEAHPNMTAIDFAGHNNTNEVNGTYKLGWDDDTNWFYLPLLDDDGLLSIVNIDETQNLLVYAPATSGDGYVNGQTHEVLTSYFIEPKYDDNYDNSNGYRLVGESTASIHGHLVQSDLTTTNDHLLVDKQDFNCPIPYRLGDEYLMWYQRKPDNQEYVDLKNGWQGISIPFTAELVTTHQKGEITHFFQGSTKGHEYWLREYSAIGEGSTTSEALATFNYPAATGTTKTDRNSFLWDYYYKNESVHNQKDENADTYLEYRTYYKDARTYPGYQLLSTATPYIIGFPGETYYEFDLSGNFQAQNTAETLEKIGKQVITFASNKGESIGVSDDETKTGVVKIYEGAKDFTVTFKPSYMNEVLENGQYAMNHDGNAYVKLDDETATSWNTTGAKYTFADEDAFNAAVATEALYTDAAGTTPLTWAVYNATTESKAATYYKRTTVKTTKNDDNHVTPALSAFRPYFTATITPSGGSVKRQLPGRIVFSSTNGSEFEGGPESALDGTLEIFSRGRNIVTRSHMKEPTTIRIVNAAGITLSDFVLPAGQTIETPVHMPGVYIVNKKKLSIK